MGYSIYAKFKSKEDADSVFNLLEKELKKDKYYILVIDNDIDYKSKRIKNCVGFNYNASGLDRMLIFEVIALICKKFKIQGFYDNQTYKFETIDSKIKKYKTELSFLSGDDKKTHTKHFLWENHCFESFNYELDVFSNNEFLESYNFLKKETKFIL
jgi:hypothetical protein